MGVLKISKWLIYRIFLFKYTMTCIIFTVCLKEILFEKMCKFYFNCILQRFHLLSSFCLFLSEIFQVKMYLSYSLEVRALLLMFPTIYDRSWAMIQICLVTFVMMNVRKNHVITNTKIKVFFLLYIAINFVKMTEISRNFRLKIFVT